jgi:hypothetical protein
LQAIARRSQRVGEVEQFGRGAGLIGAGPFRLRLTQMLLGQIQDFADFSPPAGDIGFGKAFLLLCVQESVDLGELIEDVVQIAIEVLLRIGLFLEVIDGATISWQAAITDCLRQAA